MAKSDKSRGLLGNIWDAVVHDSTAANDANRRVLGNTGNALMALPNALTYLPFRGLFGEEGWDAYMGMQADLLYGGNPTNAGFTGKNAFSPVLPPRYSDADITDINTRFRDRNPVSSIPKPTSGTTGPTSMTPGDTLGSARGKAKEWDALATQEHQKRVSEARTRIATGTATADDAVIANSPAPRATATGGVWFDRPGSAVEGRGIFHVGDERIATQRGANGQPVSVATGGADDWRSNGSRVKVTQEGLNRNAPVIPKTSDFLPDGTRYGGFDGTYQRPVDEETGARGRYQPVPKGETSLRKAVTAATSNRKNISQVIPDFGGGVLPASRKTNFSFDA